ncbi:MAG: Ppx/GppA family phosphatase [Nitrospiraceae bacterium]|nr:MAG: Ppx/GppA family phosphatase [Nitrospiraceae bacterium]
MKTLKLAAIDIGTNTFRLIIADVACDSPGSAFTMREIHSERSVTRLGEGMHETGVLSRDAMDRSMAVLKKYCHDICRYDVHKTWAVATSALREAKNSAAFLEEVTQVTELPIAIISGEEEARLTARGMLHDMDIPESALMLDIGGGSTELIFAYQGAPDYVHSLNTGVVHLAGKFMKNDPPRKEDLTAMDREITGHITSVREPFISRIRKDSVFIGTAGTVTALAAIAQDLECFDHGRIHRFPLALSRVKEIWDIISSVPSRERARLIPFELSRLDIIVPGTRILLMLMESFGFNEITVSNNGLREGTLIELYSREIRQEA